MKYTEIVLTVPAEDVDLAGDIAHMTVPYGIYIEDYRDLEQVVMEMGHTHLIDETLLNSDRSVGQVHVYIDETGSPQEAIAFLTDRFRQAGIVAQISTALCQEEDWANNWKKYFKPLPVGRRLLIRPVWEPADAGDRIVLDLEPGMAFGTGTHETTRLCLELLENYITPQTRMLDVGCGSGILAISALLLGAQQAVGVDIDQIAVKTAKENARRNGVSDRFDALFGDLTACVDGQFDLVAANIVADAVIRLTDGINRFMRPAAVYLVSGIIDTRESEVLDALQLSFDILETRRENGWTAIAARLRDQNG